MKKILIIEDEIDIANNLKAVLEDEKYIAVIASNSGEAFNKFSNEIYDLIILDVWLDNSEFDGIEILKKVREHNYIWSW